MKRLQALYYNVLIEGYTDHELKKSMQSETITPLLLTTAWLLIAVLKIGTIFAHSTNTRSSLLIETPIMLAQLHRYEAISKRFVFLILIILL